MVFWYLNAFFDPDQPFQQNNGRRHGQGSGMSRKQGPRAAGMRPTAIAAGRRQGLLSIRHDGTEAAA
jgi:hypothetical protein